jgi:oxygen-independent coproporphyrinogen-3 oxidase
MIDTCMSALRARGISAVNFDLMYGLPFQTIEKLDATLDEVIRMRPSRIALFGYAHVPQMFPRQRRIDTSALPTAEQRFAQAAHGYERLVAEGYVPIGFDHFALPEDPLAVAARKGRVRRNFQGFTEDQSDVVIGLGASAISLFPGAIIQNEKNPGTYRNCMSEGRLAGVRGVRLAPDDQRRGVLIEQLLCQLKTRLDSDLVDPQLEAMLSHFVSLGIVDWTDNVLSITDQGRPYVRNVAAALDRHAA